jgi:hypothetical protein
MYVPGRRAEMFQRVFAEIPVGSRVCSTDFIHTRFTHHERSYDYSDFPRAVTNYNVGAPDDTDYLVIDVHGRYNRITRPEQIPEYRRDRDGWELLPDVSEGYFIVLKRRRPSSNGPETP